MCRKQRSKLTSSHNLPPAEANKGRRKIRGTPPRPRQEASPPAPPIYDWMSVEDKDIVSMSFRARNTCRRDIYWLRGFPDRRTHGVTTRPRIPTLRLMNGGISYESFRNRSNRIHLFRHRPRAACGGASG